MKSQRICVIGAGASGLACLRYLREMRPAPFIRCFEASSEEGGTWNRRVGKESALYDSLRTNIPKEVMHFFDFPFKSEHMASIDKSLNRSFVTSETVETYIKDYARQLNLLKHISFDSIVKKVTYDDETSTYEVITASNNKPPIVTSFDIVIVCSGHFNTPYFPLSFSELKSSPIHLLHSKDFTKDDTYTYPPPSFNLNTIKPITHSFKHKTITIVGFKSSGFDICHKLKNIASKIHVLDPEYDHTTKPVNFPNITVYNRFLRLHNDSIVVSDFFQKEISLKTDIVVFCTGYLYDFPFLGEDLALSSDKKRVEGLHLHMQASRSLFFMGLNFAVLPFQLSCLQAVWIKSRLENEVDGSVRTEFDEYKSHSMKGIQFKYWDVLIEDIRRLCLSNLKFVDLEERKFVQEVYLENARNRPKLPTDNDEYRDVKYRSFY